jgi:hypothetical protein
LRRQAQEGAPFNGETVVLLATGAGIRWPATFDPFFRPIEAVPGEIGELGAIVAL